MQQELDTRLLRCILHEVNDTREVISTDPLRSVRDELSKHKYIWENGNVECASPSEIWQYTLNELHPGKQFWNLDNGKWEIGQ